jgi:hypothetical protein
MTTTTFMEFEAHMFEVARNTAQGAFDGPATLCVLDADLAPRVIGHGEDVYDLLSCDYGAEMLGAQYVILRTVGWAAPIGDVAPSEHKERRRCWLVIAVEVSSHEMCCVLRLSDEPDDAKVDSIGQGMLADVMRDFVLSNTMAL